MIDSKFKTISLVEFPKFTGLRIMHMPYHTHDLLSLSGVADQYAPFLAALKSHTPPGVGYLTIDEVSLKKGEVHRRPGLHVDGVDETGPNRLSGGGGGWGGGSGGGWGGGYTAPSVRAGYGATGMIVAASHLGSCAYAQTFSGEAKANGDCEHMRFQCKDHSPLLAGVAFGLEPMTVHESLPVEEDCNRQFIRISFPSNSAWYEGYTVNPNGVKPQGEIRPARKEFMNYRPDLRAQNAEGERVLSQAYVAQQRSKMQPMPTDSKITAFTEGYMVAFGWHWSPERGWYKP